MVVGSDSAGPPSDGSERERAVEPVDATIPRSTGPYVIEKELGRGGMGVVYLARDTRLGRSVAIKVLPAELARDPDRMARFRHEARFLAALNHPNIATIHGLEEDAEGRQFLILERVEGETLAERLGRSALPVAEALTVCVQVAAALEAAHERGVIHRDLKPGNVMLTPRGLVKVLDFGLARRTPRPIGAEEFGSAASFPLLTETGAMMGTPGYMSPEQVLGHLVDERTDQFAFGCVFYECVTGQRAFGRESAAASIAAVVAGDPDWSALPDATPASIQALLKRCLEKDPERRLRTIGEARREIEDTIAGRRTASGLAPASAVPHNLPRTFTTFVGRAKEISACARLLGRAHLLTLTGSGGCGKTRLALRLAEATLDEHPDGVWFVDLAPLDEGARVPHALAAVLDVRETHGEPLVQTLAKRLGERRLLVVLDNCEHLLAASADLAGVLMRGCPRLRLIATSREALGVPGEQRFVVPPLGLPDPDREPGLERIAASESVQLFVERATLADPDFRLTERNARPVAEICRQLDGIPLAIKLAAARAQMLSIEEIRSRLDERFRLLTGGARGAVPRHRTLEAAVEWSYDLLGTDEQQLLRALSVFAGGWTLAAAAAVCGGARDEFAVLDPLTRLVDKSLVMVERAEATASRYRFLETVRQYSREKLREAGEEAPGRDRHLEHFLSLAESAVPHQSGPDQVSWLARLDAEHENLLAALGWCERAEGGAEKGLRLAGTLGQFWVTRGHFGLGRRTLHKALGRAAASPATPARAAALCEAGHLAAFQTDYVQARPLYEEAMAIARALGDRRGIARGLMGLGIVAWGQSDYVAAPPFFEESLALYRELGDKRGIAQAVGNLGAMFRTHGDYVTARPFEEQCLALARQARVKDTIATSSTSLGIIDTRLGNLEAARREIAEGIRLVRELGAKLRGAEALEAAAELAASSGDPALAARLCGAAAALRERIAAPHDADSAEQLEAAIAGARSCLGGKPFLRAQAAGREMSMEVALESALEWLEHRAPEPRT